MSAERRQLAGTLLAIALGHVRGRDIGMPPWIEWFEPDGAKSGSFSRERQVIELSTALDGLELAKTIAHEVRHLVDDGHDRDAMELRALEHELRYAGAYLKAAEILDADERENIRLYYERHGVTRGRPGVDLIIRESGELDRVRPRDVDGWSIGREPKLAGSCRI